MDNEKFKRWFDKTLEVLIVVFAVCWTILKWIFAFYAFIFGTIFWLLDLWLGDGRNPVRPPWDKPRGKNVFNPAQFREEFPQLKVEDILKEFKDKLEQAERQGKLEPEQKQVVQKLRQFDRSKYNSRLRDVFEDDELDELLLLILMLLGVEIG